MTTSNCVYPTLTAEDVDLILEALDSHEYWQLSAPAWRQDGSVVLATDDPARWAERPDPTNDEQAQIDEIQRCRTLAVRLRSSVLEASQPRTSDS